MGVVDMGVVDDLRRAREAYERRDWVATYEGLSDLDGQALHGDDYAHLASAAFLTGRTGICRTSSPSWTWARAPRPRRLRSSTT